MDNLLKWDANLSASLRLVPTHRGWWKLMVFLAHSGDSWFWLTGLAIVWLISKHEWHTKTAILAIGVIGLAVLVLAIKFMVRRQRPPGEWGAIYRNTDPHSFPSGHASRAFMLATVALGLGPSWFGILLLIWAPLVCLARVSTGVHYLSDVFAGMFLGILAGWLILGVQSFIPAFLPFIF